MARLRIVELPPIHRGDAMQTPFILVVDQFTDRPLVIAEEQRWQQLRDDTGAAACLLYPDQLDLE